MKTINVRFRGSDYRARIKAGEEWTDAAKRAVRRAAGRSATARGWTLDAWEQNAEGETVRRHYKATICGREDRVHGAPILGEARVSF